MELGDHHGVELRGLLGVRGLLMELGGCWIAGVFALDVQTAAAKLPCEVTGFNFWSRVQAVIYVPPIVALFLALCGVLWAAWARRRGAGGDGQGIGSAGLWKAAPVILFIIDLIYPTLTRTLCQFFTCRDLASAGLFLEADYSVQPVAILQRTFLLS